MTRLPTNVAGPIVAAIVLFLAGACATDRSAVSSHAEADQSVGKPSVFRAIPADPDTDAPGGEVLSVPIGDGLNMHSVLYLPEGDGDGNGKVPAVVIVHGFKQYHVRAGAWQTYWARAIAEHHGYAAAAVTMRGWPDTGGVNDCGLKQPDDLVLTVQALARHDRIDANRIALMGGSQGGKVVLLAAARDTSIKAVIAQFATVDVELWRANERHSPGIIEYIDTVCTSPGSKEARSPLLVAGQINAPVLLMHGDADPNVQVEHTHLMYEALKANGKDVEVFIARGGGHGNMSGVGWEDGERTLFDFLARKL